MPPRQPPRPRRPKPALLLAALGVMGLAVLAGTALYSRSAAGGGPGPLVVISIDTLRADRVGAYGYSLATTPVIDRLAREGVLVDRALSHSPQTLPSHASMLTGRLPFQHGVRDNIGFTLGPSVPTLAEVLGARGYRSAGFVSAFVLRPETGIGRGFGLFDAALPPAAPGASMGSVRRDGADTVERARRWVAAQRDGRFFLFVHLYEPHRPWQVPAMAGGTPRYDAAIAYADALVGRLLEALAGSGFYDPALVVLLSDHGEGLGDHGEEEHGVFLYEETTRVPFIAKLPAGRAAGRRLRGPIQLIDLLPTLADAAGAAVPAGLEGRSLLPLIDRRENQGERGVYAEALYPLYHFAWSPLYSLSDGRYRFVLAPEPELYDLERDPGERRNIAADRPSAAAAMRRALEARINPHVERPSPVSDEERARFQALGYIGQAEDTALIVRDARPDPKAHIHSLERYRLGVTLMSERRVPEAIAAFQSVVADQPTMIDVWMQLGSALARVGRHREAIDALTHVVALNPGASDAVLAIADALLRLGRPAEAAEQARAALARQPARSHEVLARAALAEGRLAGALDEARLAQSADPALPLPAYIEGAIHHARGDYAAALGPLRRAAEQAEARRVTLPDLRYLLGDALARLGREAEAEREFRGELQAFPENGRARAALALLYGSRGGGHEARALLDELVVAAPTAESYELAVRTAAILGESAHAARLLGQGLQRFPGNTALRSLHAGLRRRGADHGAPQ